MLSMTGYGRGEIEDEKFKVVAELKSVNNRYLDVAVKAPRIFIAYEEVLRATLREYITRGHIDLYINFSDKRKKAVKLTLDEVLARAYADSAKRVKEICPEVEYNLSVTDVLRYPEVLKCEDASACDDEGLESVLCAVKEALKNLNTMREAEGKKLEGDMLLRLAEIEKGVNAIALRAPLIVENYKAKLEAKLKSFLGGEIDENRILTEVTLFADRCNIDEELTRLRSHIAQFREIAKEKIVGRKLDFLVQEFNREANTICSKSNDTEITRTALSLKNEIEKIREQVQNVE